VASSGGAGGLGSDQRDGSKGFNDPSNAGEHVSSDANNALGGGQHIGSHAYHALAGCQYIGSHANYTLVVGAVDPR
jgi:hypothetical protein